MLQRGERLHFVPGLTDYDQPASSSSQQISAHYLGFVPPLNHTRHRNPLVSVTFSPTQEARSQSTIWMRLSLSSYFQIYIPSIPPRLYKHCLTITFSAFVACCVFPFVYGQQSLYHLTILSASSPPKKYFSLMSLPGRCIASTAVLKLQNWQSFQCHVLRL